MGGAVLARAEQQLPGPGPVPRPHCLVVPGAVLRPPAADAGGAGQRGHLGAGHLKVGSEVMVS